MVLTLTLKPHPKTEEFLFQNLLLTLRPWAWPLKKKKNIFVYFISCKCICLFVSYVSFRANEKLKLNFRHQICLGWLAKFGVKETFSIFFFLFERLL